MKMVIYFRPCFDDKAKLAFGERSEMELKFIRDNGSEVDLSPIQNKFFVENYCTVTFTNLESLFK